MNILIVRLGALGDIVHAIPAAAALRAAHPSARIDWVVDARHRGVLDLVSGLDRVVTIAGPAPVAWVAAVRELRARAYDLAIDFQGLMKSAVLARASGARRVVGFSIWHLREKTARPFYSEVAGDRDQAGQAEEHVIAKNLRMLRLLGIEDPPIEFPLVRFPSAALDDVIRELGGAPFALINPGAAWPNKRWPADRFGAVAAFLRDVRRLRSLVLWGPGEAPLAHAVVEASDDAAMLAPPTRMGDVLELSRAAALMISGDTGPLHLAAAVRTPIVALFGPTDPLRNGPFSSGDVVVSRHDSCGCHYQRRCRRGDEWCLGDLGVTEVTAAIQHRLGPLRHHAEESR